MSSITGTRQRVTKCIIDIKHQLQLILLCFFPRYLLFYKRCSDIHSDNTCFRALIRIISIIHAVYVYALVLCYIATRVNSLLLLTELWPVATYTVYKNIFTTRRLSVCYSVLHYTEYSVLFTHPFF